MDNSIQAHQKELCNKLWAMANALRGNMEAYEFKNYILGMIFYYYLSDRTEKYMTRECWEECTFGSYLSAWDTSCTRSFGRGRSWANCSDARLS